MTPERLALIERIHAAGTRCVVAVTGGGAAACADLLAVPGASRTVLEVVVPYANAALADFLGSAPAQFCSADAASAMADRALTRARRLAPDGLPLAGVSCTATLATDRPKRGDHRFFVAVHTAAERVTLALTLSKGARDRAGEESVVGDTMLNALAAAAGLSDRLPVPLVEGETPIETREPNGLLGEFLLGRRDAVCQAADGRLCEGPLPAAVLPGSFNPLHEGHRGMAAAAEQLLGGRVDYELSVRNVDKPDLGGEEVCRRLRQFGGHAAVWLTRAPTFDRKAALFPGAAFVVGVDTAARIVDPRYWGGTPEGLATALQAIRGAGSRFVVAGRVNAGGTFAGLDGLTVPADAEGMFVALPNFRLDVSSTQLRTRATPRERG